MTSNASEPVNQRIRILVVDDHTLFREGLVALLKGEADLDIIAQTGDGDEAMTLVRQFVPDIALLDITMPKHNGLELASRITSEHPSVRVLMLTMHQEETFFFEALRVGAAGYVLKGSGSESLFHALRAVHQAGVYLPPALAGGIVREYLESHPNWVDTDPLTPREREVLSLIAQGLTNSMISARLTLSLNTVKTHRLRIYQKLHLDNRAELVAYAMRRGLLNSSPNSRNHPRPS